MKLGLCEKALAVASLLALTSTLAALACGYVCGFSGQLCLAPGAAENVAVREAVPPGPLHRMPKGARAGVTPEEIPLNAAKARLLLDPRTRYDYMALHFEAQLKDVAQLGEPEADYALQVTTLGARTSVPIEEGAHVALAGRSYQVAHIGKWSGLLRDARGAPMAAIALRQAGADAWTQDLFLMAGTWQRFDPGIGVLLTWSASENEARERFNAGLPGIEAARWGVVDGPAVSWFSQFDPGAGAQLASGETVTLLQFDPARPGPEGPAPAIEVEFRDGGQRQTAWVFANQANDEARVRFEHYAALDTVLLLDAWEDGSALVRAFHRGQRFGAGLLRAGEVWAEAPFPYEFRLDQALAEGLPVTAQDSSLSEAVLQETAGGRPGGQLRLREAEAVRVDDTLAEFVRTSRPAPVRLSLVARRPGGSSARSFSLGPEDAVSLHGWTLSQAVPAFHDGVAVLEARYVPGRAWMKGSLAALLVAVIMLALRVPAERPKAGL